MANLLASLNPEQRKVATHFKGPLLVSAVAGSGKTTAMTHRIAYLIKHYHVDPRRILATTFTRKAAAHMNEKLKSLGITEARVGTLHSVAYEILRKDGRTSRYQGAFKVKRDHAFTPGQAVRWWGVDKGSLLRYIGWCKNLLLTPAAAKRDSGIVRGMGIAINDAQYCSAYAGAEAKRIFSKVITFDDILLQCWLLLTNEPQILQKWRDHYHFIIVDEVQDTCKAQHEIMRLLAEPRNNLCVVGDLDQSIYSFRGALPEYMLDFAKKYPNSIVNMESNYRSTPDICASATRLIGNNSQRLPMTNRAQRTAPGTAAFGFRLFDTPEDEQDYMVKELLASRVHYKWRDMAILCRTNNSCGAFEAALLARKIPYRRIGGAAAFLERRLIVLMLDYLRFGRALFLNKFDLDAYLTIANTPRRGLGQVYVERLLDLVEKKGEKPITAVLTAAATKKQQQQIETLLDLGDRTAAGIRNRVGPSRVLEWLHGELNLPEVLSGRHPLGFKIRRANEQLLSELISLAARYRTTKRFLRFLDEYALDADADVADDSPSADEVTLSTIHRAKGLEFGVVLLPSFVEGILPHKMAGNEPQGIEEERRLAYVAVTRAKDVCLVGGYKPISSDGPKNHPYSIVSRFVWELGFRRP